MSTPEIDTRLDDTAPDGASPSRRRYLPATPRGRAVATAVAAVVLIGGFALYRHFAARETTDDAQIAGHLTPIAARVGGTLRDIEVDDNQHVEAGAVLAHLDPSDYQVAVARATADVAAASAALDAARAGLPIASADATAHETTADAEVQRAATQVAAAIARRTAAQAGLREAQARNQRAQRDLERLDTLIARDEVSRQQHDAAVADADASQAAVEAAQAGVVEAERGLEAAEAGLDQARAQQRAAATAPQRIAASKAQVAAAEARLEQAKAALERARLDLGYTTITAPVAGIVAHRAAEPGQTVQPGQPLFALVPLSDVWVTANFKETQLRAMRPGQPAVVTVDATGRSYRGHVDSISPATGASFSLLPAENASGNYVKVVQRVPVKIVLDDGQDPQHLLRPGMSVVPTVVTSGS